MLAPANECRQAGIVITANACVFLLAKHGITECHEERIFYFEMQYGLSLKDPSDRCPLPEPRF